MTVEAQKKLEARCHIYVWIYERVGRECLDMLNDSGMIDAMVDEFLKGETIVLRTHN